MGRENRTKLNRLLTRWPRGTVATASFLVQSGFGHDLLTKYKNRGWLESFGRGAYKLTGDPVQWPGALYALQRQLHLEIHAGGRTALEIKGYAHFLPLKNQRVFLYGAPGVALPSWFQGKRLGVEILLVRTNLFAASDKEGLSEHELGEFSVTISAPERAAMEMLHLVPQKTGFEDAFHIMENLVNLRPSVLEQLLQICRSVKVKRLFLYMAENLGHAWMKRIDLSKIDLGRGKRVIVPGGKLARKYQITVPAREEHGIG